MLKKDIFRYISGYIVGFGLFIVILPASLYFFSKIDHFFFRQKILAGPWLPLVVAPLLFALGMAFVIWSNIVLFRMGKGGPADGFNIVIHPRTKKLVITGPYRYTRNPMVFGTLTVYYALVFYLDSLAAFLLLVLFSVLVTVYLKLIEEKRLLRDFGQRYAEYRKRTSMIIPFLKK
ncbi:MAG: isoprenylcysteine carboxylmethyltransferase family protein [Spirochaetes bacterium]|nr:isoprenylcysteine carboxylmethyltransferase family protein [Spirochaetota bacterium]